MSSTTPASLPLALTMGDPAGIGPDITLLAWQRRQELSLPPFLLLGDPEVLAARARQLDLALPIALIETADEAAAAFADALPILPVTVSATVVAGLPDGAAAAAVQGSIERAVDLVLGGRVGAVVTNPISKAVLYGAGFPFPGHTEYLASLAECRGEPAFPVMLLASEELKVVPITIHIPLADVPQALTTELILQTLRVTAKAMQRYFGIARPRLALTGLNPHAGEGGSLGKEEERLIVPAIAAARGEGLNVSGPYPADTLFHAEARRTYDVALATYHDQALIPIKTLAFDTGVNVTLGLPFIRTSPDHGTAFSRAGTGKASPKSLIEAVRLAHAMLLQAEGDLQSAAS